MKEVFFHERWFPKYCVLRVRMAVAEANVITSPHPSNFQAEPNLTRSTRLWENSGRWANPKPQAEGFIEVGGFRVLFSKIAYAMLKAEP